MGIRPVGRPPKPDAIRQRKHKRHLTTLAHRDQEQRVVMKAPPGLLPASRKLWRAYWASPVSRASEVNADAGLLQRWIEAVNEWQIVYEEFKRERIVAGSHGQPVLNPLASYMKTLEQTITYAEQQLGLTPVARIRLGIAIGEAKLTAHELNRRLAKHNQQQEAEDDQFDAEIEGQWEAI